ncbi:MAG: hypothetical protein HOE11_02825 [Candidatus Diapherotrites archaeon]|nr:hypothetical protein [Candidatus Diapherotrites archaeon]
MALFRRLRNWVVRPKKTRRNGVISYSGSKHKLAYTPEFKAWVKHNPGALDAFHFIRKNLHHLKPFVALKDKKTGTTIEPLCTGEYKGNNALHRLSVVTKDREFFCKIKLNGKALTESDANRKVEAQRQAKPIIRELNKRGLNVALAPTHIIYETKIKDGDHEQTVTFVVSDFYHAHDVESVVGKLYHGNNILPENYIKTPANDQLSERVKQIRNMMLDYGVFDVHAHNMFLNKKTGQIIIFDINSA